MRTVCADMADLRAHSQPPAACARPLPRVGDFDFSAIPGNGKIRFVKPLLLIGFHLLSTCGINQNRAGAEVSGFQADLLAPCCPDTTESLLIFMPECMTTGVEGEEAGFAWGVGLLPREGVVMT